MLRPKSDSTRAIAASSCHGTPQPDSRAALSIVARWSAASVGTKACQSTAASTWSDAVGSSVAAGVGVTAGLVAARTGVFVGVGVAVTVDVAVPVGDGLGVHVGDGASTLGDDDTRGARCGAGDGLLVGVGAARATAGAAMLNTSDPTATTSDRRMAPG